jgi:hypothetical protein
MLLDRHRQSRMNDLLEQAGKTGNVDEAFRRAYHQSYDERGVDQEPAVSGSGASGPERVGASTISAAAGGR